MSIDPRRFAFLALLTLIPVALFAIGRSSVVVLAAVSVLVIAWSLYSMFGPSQSAAPTG